ncbi:hypothetical protein D3C80_1834690 [compost metagenome]
MPRQRSDPAGIPAPGTEHTGNMHKWLHLRDVNQRHQFLFITVTQQILKQFGLRTFDALCHLDGGVNVRHGVMRIAVFNPVGAGQMF